ncbi:chitobiase/beta-hexosaminidase C-terminal domain-containing protein [Methanobacterium sp.]|uniref:chitobiase/beta-hexosaminidase C-terminal domain-containing protein n=1 Tax=Methanobacterium sp. TaxID=2164 RepID=UPI003C71446B
MQDKINGTSMGMIALIFISMAFVFSISIGTVAASSNAIYVNTAGNDSWDGQYATWNGTSGPKLTIKNAAGTVTSGGTVYIANGTYNETGISVYNKNVNFIGESRDSTIINGGKKGRLFNVGAQGVTYTYSFTNLTFLNGNSTSGGAIWNYGSTTITNCVFINNTATYSGGAIINYGTGSAPGSYVVTDSYFSGNKVTSGNGGAIYNGGLGPVSVIGCDFTDNTASGTGSVLYNSLGSTSTIQFSRIIGTGNSLIAFQSGSPTVDASLNWWGSNSDPTSKVQSGVTVGPWLVLTPQAPENIGSGVPTSIYADLLHDSGILTDPTNPDLYYYDPIFGHVPDGIPATFTGDALGSVNPLNGFTLNGLVMTNFTGIARGISHPSFTVDSQTVSADITVGDITPPTVTPNPTGGVYNVTKNVALTISEPGTVYYTTDGSDPKTSATRKVYSTPIVISTSTTLRFIAVDLAGNWSPGYMQTYKIDKTAPTASAKPSGGLYNTSKLVTLTMSEAGTIYYTTNGATPTTSSTIYKGPITISSTTILKFLAVDKAGNKSPVYTQKYTIDRTAPKVTSTSPANGATRVSRTAAISIKFSESIKASTNWSKIYMKNLTTGKLVSITTSISGNTLYIKMRLDRLPNNNYQIYIPADAVKDNAGNKLASAYTFKFRSA